MSYAPDAQKENRPSFDELTQFIAQLTSQKEQSQEDNAKTQ